jgi:hypothetical protein
LTPDEATPGSEDLERRIREELDADIPLDGEEVAPGPAAAEGLTAEYMEYTHSGPLPGIPWFEAVERLAPGSTEKMLMTSRSNGSTSAHCRRKRSKSTPRTLMPFPDISIYG